jgi:hypothetical protein
MMSSARWPSVSTVAGNRWGDDDSSASNSKIYLLDDSVCDVEFCDRWLRVTRRDTD